MMWLHSFISALAFFAIQRAEGTLIPSSSVSIDCGGQQTFTCTVTGTFAAWTVTGLMGITAAGSNAIGVAAASARFTTTDTVLSTTSTITITGIKTNDNGGTVQCVDISGVPRVEGMATIAVVSTTLASATAVMANVDQCSATLTWSEPSDSSATTSVSCTPSSPQCSSCTSSGCTIGGLTPNTSYTFSVTRSRSGCDHSTAVSSAVMSGAPVSCPANVVAALPVSDAVTVTWSLPPTSPPVTSTTVTYCPTSSPNCGDSQVCTSPCTVINLEPDTEYSFTVTAITSSNCEIRSCNGTTITAETACPVASAPTASAILSGVIPSVALILTNIISVVVVFLVTRHCYKKSAKGDSSSRREELYEQVERKKVYEDINMTDSPAYGPVI